MFITDLFEEKSRQTLVLIPGGFHPFHPGHLSLYRSAEAAFPGATIVYVATDDRKDRPFPFAEKQRLAQIAGVNPQNFQLVKSPFVAKEVTRNFDPNNTVLIFARSEKDRDEQPKPGGVKKDGSLSYLQPYTKGNLAPMSEHGYMAYLPTVQFDAGPSGVTSATQIREMWPKADDSQKNAIVDDLYPRNPKLAAQILDRYLGTAMTEDELDEACWKGYHREGNKKMFGKTYPNCVKNEGVAEAQLDEGTMAEFTPEIISILKSQGYKGPYKLKQLRKWNKELNGYQGLHSDSDIMVQGNDIDFDGWIASWGNEFLTGAEHQSGPISIQKLFKRGVVEAKNKNPVFVKVASWQQWEDEMYRRGGEYYETEIDGHHVGVANIGSYDPNVVGLWYNQAGFGTFVKGGPVFNSSVWYSELDPNWPYLNEDVAEEQLDEKWSQKYKSSINCANPKGFSQKAHCAGRKKNEDLQEQAEQCPECGGPMFSELMINEKKDACYYKVKSRYKVWPSAYASGALVKCRKSHGKWGTKSEGVMSDLDQDRQDVNFDSIVGYVINGLKKNQDIGRMELDLYKWGGKELVDVDQELQDRGFRDLADLADHIRQHNGKYIPPTDFGLSNSGEDVVEGSLNEFARGENGFGPFKIYLENHFIKQFSTFDEAKDEVDFLRDSDPKSATHHWRIVDGTGETVWEFEIGAAYDAMRSGNKIQYRNPGHKGVAEGVNDYLWHGSRNEHKVLYPQQANDEGGKEGSNKNAVYATPSAKTAISFGLTTPGSVTGMFPNDPQMVLFKGGIRKGQMVYLHKVPKDLFVKHNGREWYSKPGVTEVKPIETKAIPVDKYLNLIRQATPQDLELRKKYMKQGVAEGSDDIETTRQFRDANALAKSQKAIRQAQYGKDQKFYADGTPVTPEEVARRAAERKAKKKGVAEDIDPDLYEDLDPRIIARAAKRVVPDLKARSTPEGYVHLTSARGLDLYIGCNVADGEISINLGSGGGVASSGEDKGAVTEIIKAVHDAAVKTYGQPSKPGSLSVDDDAGHGVWQHIASKLGLEYSSQSIKEQGVAEGVEHLEENLHKWFKEKWVRFGPDGKIRGDCARGSDSEGKPKCLPQSKAHSLGKKGRASAAARKRREDPNPERRGKAINVNTKRKTNESSLAIARIDAILLELSRSKK